VLKSRSWGAIVSIVSVSCMAHGPFLYSCWLLSKHRCTEPLTASYPTAMAHGWPDDYPSATSNALASWRSAVSKPSVNQP
jgi:hypothetical protein